MGIIDKLLELEQPKKDPTANEVMTKPEIKESKHAIRTMGNVRVAAEAQRIFNPGLPPTKPKGPTAAQQDSGVVAAMGTEGNWGSNV